VTADDPLAIMLTTVGALARSAADGGQPPMNGSCSAAEPPKLTLSFDNGPDPALTPRVLDILSARSLRATFFVVGEQVARPGGRRVVERAVESGHRVGNHTMSHGTPLGLRPADEAVSEIARADEVLAGLSCDPPLFRPNGCGELGPHVLSPAAVDHLLAHYHTVVTWTSVPRDWEEPDGSWIPRAVSAIENGGHSLLVLHDVLPATVDHLPSFLDALLERGVAFTDEFPEECVAISAGRRLPPLQGLVRGSGA
jgi:peptidoglycan-N-acetylglucosamine deacetylase